MKQPGLVLPASLSLGECVLLSLLPSLNSTVELHLELHLERRSAPMRWRELPHIPAGQRPLPWLHHWLFDTESLTAKLVALSSQDFHVQVLHQAIERPRLLNERQVLGMEDKARALVREVVLCGRNQPWVFARSVLPLSSLEGPLRHLRKQGSRPLGAFLFSQPHLKRGAIAVTAISRDHDYVPHSLMGAQTVWGRRSVFSLNSKPLLVSEVFLEPLIQVLQAKTNRQR